MKLFHLTIIMLLTLVNLGWGQTKRPKTLDELAVYTGSDRQQILLDGAKAEGKIVWYTSLSGNYKEIVEAFKKKYPEINIDVYRAGSNDVAQRLVSEAQAGRYLADALEVTPGSLMLLRERNILKPYLSPDLAKYPEEAKTKADGNRVFWVTDRESYLGFAYNTRLIAANDVPKSFEDLLKPGLKGKMAISGEASSDRVIGAMAKYKGDEFINKLKGAGDEDVQGREHGLSRSDDRRGNCRHARDVSQHGRGQTGKKRAGRMGAAGCSADQCRRSRDNK